MVLSRVLGEQWLYGFLGATFSHSTAWPGAVHGIAWFGFAWNLVHVNDTPDEQRVFHVHHLIMLWIGALIGRAFVWAFRTPRLIETDFIMYPWKTAMLLAIYLGSVGGYLLVSLLTEPGGVSFPFVPASTGIAVIVTTLAIAVIASVIIVSQLVMAGPGANSGKTFLKYLVNVPVLILTTSLLAQHWALLLLGLVLVYVLLYVWARYVGPRIDTAFTGKTRNTRILRFYTWFFVLHALAFLLANLTDHCFAGANSPTFPPGCGLHEAVSAVFWALTVFSIVALLFLLSIVVNRRMQQRRTGRTNLRSRSRTACNTSTVMQGTAYDE